MDYADFVHTIVLVVVIVVVGIPSTAVGALLGGAGGICCRYFCTSSCVVSAGNLSTVTIGCCASKGATGMSVYNKNVYINKN